MKKKLNEIPLSALDLATICQGDTLNDAFNRSLRLARHAEHLGLKRYWFAEHHNFDSVASAATSVLIGFIAGGTQKIRVGAGGVMLPNHSPLVIAEQFGTLEALYPGRIDLGLGRAPGTDPQTSWALRRRLEGGGDDFPNDVAELLTWLGPAQPDARVRAIPGQDSNIPVWLLGSSLFSARLAGMLGLPYAFASHFAPTYLLEALKTYSEHFNPSQYLSEPYAMACVNIIAADTDEEAEYLASSFYQMALGIFRNSRHPLPPPVKDMGTIWTPQEEYGVRQMMHYSFIGSQKTIAEQLQGFLDRTGVDEVMLSATIFDTEARLHSMELAAGLFSSV